MDVIAGYLRLDGGPVRSWDIAAMLQVLPSRGNPVVGARGSVGLGGNFWHLNPPEDERNAIDFDPTAGCTLIAAVELHNREALAAALGLDACDSRRLRDEFLILKAYAKWGVDCPQYLLGRFAFALYDDRTQRLFCARDHTGMATFNYHRTATRFAFASGPNALFALPHIAPQIDTTTAAEFAILLPPSPEASMYQGISRLPPGHSMCVGKDYFQIRQYWELTYTGPLILNSDQEYGEAFREVFLQAVSCRVRGKQTGVFLSGGLDSSAIAAVAAHQLMDQGKTLNGYCAIPRVGFPQQVRNGRDADESKYVAALAIQWPNLKVHYDAAVGRVPLEHAEFRFATKGWPSFSPTNELWILALLEHCQNDGCDTVLVGQLGNAALSLEVSGYLAYLAQSRRWADFVRELRGYSKFYNMPSSRLIMANVLALAPGIRSFFRKLFRKESSFWSSYSFVNLHMAKALDLQGRFFAAYRTTDHSLRPFSIENHCRGLRHLLSIVGDHWTPMAGAFGLHFADPSADKRVLEFCLSLPLSQHVKNGRNRRMIRDHLREFLPAMITERISRGRQGADSLERALATLETLKQMYARLETSKVVLDILDLNRLKMALQALPHQTNDKRHWGILRALELASFCHWAECELPMAANRAFGING